MSDNTQVTVLYSISGDMDTELSFRNQFRLKGFRPWTRGSRNVYREDVVCYECGGETDYGKPVCKDHILLRDYPRWIAQKAKELGQLGDLRKKRS